MLYNAVRPKSKPGRRNEMLVYTDYAAISFLLEKEEPWQSRLSDNYLS